MPETTDSDSAPAMSPGPLTDALAALTHGLRTDNDNDNAAGPVAEAA
jgi:hypothetical protein